MIPPTASAIASALASYDDRPIDAFRLDPLDDAGTTLNPEGHEYLGQLVEQILTTRKLMKRHELELARASSRLQDLIGPRLSKFVVPTVNGIVLVEPDPNAGWARPRFTEQADLTLG